MGTYGEQWTLWGPMDSIVSFMGTYGEQWTLWRAMDSMESSILYVLTSGYINNSINRLGWLGLSSTFIFERYYYIAH